MSDISTNLAFPYLAAGQAQKHVTVNESLRKLDALVQLAVESATTTAEPASPSDGQIYILPGGKTGAHWGAMSNGALAYWRDGAWEQIAPREGFTAFVRDQHQLYAYSSGAWATNQVASSGLCQGRLTLSSSTPFMTTDVTAAATVYFTPSHGNQLALYDGAAWRALAFTEKAIKLADTQSGATTNASTTISGLTDTSQLIVGMEATGTGIPAGATIASVPTSTSITLSAAATASATVSIIFKIPADTNLDIFGFSNAGALKLECVRWSNSTTRATALALQDGVHVKSGDAPRRYLGSVRTVAAGQGEFTQKPAAAAGGSFPKLYVYNAQNRCRVAATCRDSTDTWIYTTLTLRPSNNSSSNRIGFLCGLAEGFLEASFTTRADNSLDDVYRVVAIGYDSTTTMADGALSGQSEGKAGRTGPQLIASFKRGCEIGSHYVQELEASNASGTTTWFGDGGAPTLLQTGLTLSLNL